MLKVAYRALNITGICQHAQCIIIYHFITMGVSQASSVLVYLPTIPSLLFFWIEMHEESRDVSAGNFKLILMIKVFLFQAARWLSLSLFWLLSP